MVRLFQELYLPCGGGAREVERGKSPSRGNGTIGEIAVTVCFGWRKTPETPVRETLSILIGRLLAC
jgi:hypothetical protein